MQHYPSLKTAFPICEAIGSAVRLEILEEILAKGSINLDTLAHNLHLTNGALTSHIRKLESVGLIAVTRASGRKGSQKLCSIALSRLVIDIANTLTPDNAVYIPIGSYSAYSISGYCGLCSANGYIGMRDEPRYFSYPEKHNAAALWFGSGYISYLLPIIFEENDKILELNIGLEIASRSASYRPNYTSEIVIYISEIKIGSFNIGGDNVDRSGYLTPDFYPIKECQYGSYKTITVNSSGSFVDGVKIGDTKIDELKLASRNTFTLSTHQTGSGGGLMLFGSGFGDSDCMISYRLKTDNNMGGSLGAKRII